MKLLDLNQAGRTPSSPIATNPYGPIIGASEMMAAIHTAAQEQADTAPWYKYPSSQPKDWERYFGGVIEGVAGVAVGGTAIAGLALASPFLATGAAFGLAGYGGYSMGNGGYQVATGNQVDMTGAATGRTLTSGDRAELAGQMTPGAILTVAGAAYSVNARLSVPKLLPTQPQLPGASVLPRSPLSTRLSPSLEPGTYVYAQDASGVVRVVPQAAGAHPTVLGAGQPAAAAGEITIGSNGVVTEINNISGTFQHGANVLPAVQRAAENQGLKVAPGALKPFQW